MLILGIETSCDDTAASILDNNRILSNVLSSQDTIHTKFGGVVPELASRSHLQSIYPIVKESLVRAKLCLADIDLISVTQGPGLMGSLLVGFSFGLAYKLENKDSHRWVYRPLMSLFSTLILSWLIFYSTITIRRMIWSRA